MTRNKKLILAGWLIVFTTAFITTFVELYLNLSKENKNTIVFIVFFTGTIITAIFWIIADYFPISFRWIMKRIKKGKTKAPS